MSQELLTRLGFEEIDSSTQGLLPSRAGNPQVTLSKSGKLFFNAVARDRFEINKQDRAVFFYNKNTREMAIKFTDEGGRKVLKHNNNPTQVDIKPIINRLIKMGVLSRISETFRVDLHHDEVTGTLLFKV